MHKKYRRQDRDPGWLGHILYWLGDVVTSVLPLGRHTNTSPKKSDNGKVVKIVKVHFHNSSLLFRFIFNSRISKTGQS